MTAPVTVLMAVRNGSRFLRTAVDSILGQSFRDFRFLIVDDESTDEARQILRSYQDPRIELLCLEKNVGQTAALNLGLRRAASPWIARMDADDYSHSRRLEVQMQSLEQHPDVRCVGTAIWEFREDPQEQGRVVRRPARHDQIRQAAFYGCGMIHGSLLVDRQALLSAGGYDERYRYAADRELFIRLFSHVRGMNLPEPLLGIRRHPQQDSFSKGAADEYIDLFRRLMEQKGFGCEEREILRGSLADSYLFRADWFFSHGGFREGFGDIARSFRTRPTRTIRTLVGKLVK